MILEPNNFRAIDVDSYSVSSSSGGDPHIVSLYNNHFMLDNTITKFRLVRLISDNNSVEVIANCGNLTRKELYRKHKYVDPKNPFKRRLIDTKGERYYLTHCYIKSLEIVKNGKRSVINTLDLEFIENGGIDYYLIGSEKGLYSLTHNIYYSKSQYIREMNVILDTNTILNIKTDKYWDETNLITVYTNSLNTYLVKDGAIFEKNYVLEVKN
jgi:hypothetical protein